MSFLGARPHKARPGEHCSTQLKSGGSWTASHQRARKGIPEGYCWQPVYFEVDGKLYCRGHAGARALEILLEGTRT